MLIRLFVSLMLLSSMVSAQSNTTVSRILVKDSLSINGKWISKINNDSTLESISESSISTDAALKKYIDRATAGVGSSADITKMIRNQNALEVAVLFWTGQRMTPLVNFNLNFLSSDGIKSTYYVSGYHPYEVFSVYGKPPFSVYATINNTTSDSVLSIKITTAEDPGVNTYINYENIMLIKPGDTALIAANRLRGYLAIGIESWIRTYPENQLRYINEKIKNHSATHSITLTKAGVGDLVLMPGQEVSQRNIWLDQLGFSDNVVRAGAFRMAVSGEYLSSPYVTSPVRCSVYRNGVLFRTKDILVDDHDFLLSFELDPTWEDYEIILEDIQP